MMVKLKVEWLSSPQRTSGYVRCDKGDE